MADDTRDKLQALMEEYKNSDPANNVRQAEALQDDNEHRNLTEKEPRRMREDPVAFMLNLGLHYRGTGWRGYKTYIGNKIFYPEFSPRMKSLVLNSESVQKVIDQLADRQAEQLAIVQKKKNISEQEYQRRVARQRKALRRELEAVAKGIADKCISTMDNIRNVRFFAFALNNILVRLYHQGIHIKESQWVELKRIALMAQQKKQSLILAPCHKSHIDYLVVSYIFFRLGLQVPHIVAGENLDLPLLGPFLKSCGAFFIKREWGGNGLYKTIMEEYITTLLLEGMNLECFIEGTRSRLGKLLSPKLGIVKIVLDAIISGRVSDCYIVPMSLGYDKIIETSSYANELLGNPKEKESLWGLVTNTRILQLKWGRVDVRLSKPFSLRGWLEDQLKMRGSMDLTNTGQKSILLKSLGYRILSDINAISVVMPSALLGTVMLTLRGRGVGRSELIRRVDWLTRVIRSKGGQVAEFYGMSTGVVVDRTVSIHKDLIAEQKVKDLLEPTFYCVNPFELSYYRNQVIHMFVEEAIACVALYTVVKLGGSKVNQRMRYTDLLDEISFLSSLLKLDMIYKPGGVENNTKRTVRWLADNDVFEVTDDGWVTLSDAERACGRENYDFLCFLIWPFIDSYWLAAVSLFSLAQPNRPSVTKGSVKGDMKVFSNRAQALGKTLYYQGDLNYLEAVNKETLSTAFNRYQEQDIITIQRHATPKSWIEISLTDHYVPERVNGMLIPQGALWDLADRIGKFRMEGKNRRDSQTVSTRVLRLAEILAEENATPSANQKTLLKKRSADKSKL
ncbi:putative acyltransferase [Lichtheimia hyalospora FSU 10163]|nr:putative acyltransferase [Lichtheimia hyalospora FSU 10163]